MLGAVLYPKLNHPHPTQKLFPKELVLPRGGITVIKRLQLLMFLTVLEVPVYYSLEPGVLDLGDEGPLQGGLGREGEQAGGLQEEEEEE